MECQSAGHLTWALALHTSWDDQTPQGKRSGPVQHRVQAAGAGGRAGVLSWLPGIWDVLTVIWPEELESET